MPTCNVEELVSRGFPEGFKLKPYLRNSRVKQSIKTISEQFIKTISKPQAISDTKRQGSVLGSRGKLILLTEENVPIDLQRNFVRTVRPLNDEKWSWDVDFPTYGFIVIYIHIHFRLDYCKICLQKTPITVTQSLPTPKISSLPTPHHFQHHTITSNTNNTSLPTPDICCEGGAGWGGDNTKRVSCYATWSSVALDGQGGVGWG